MLDKFLINSFGEKNLNISRRIFLTLGYVGIMLVFFMFLSSVQKVPTESMTPTIEVGDYVYTNKISGVYKYNKMEYKRDDIITFCYEGENVLGLGYCTGETYVKRIVGLPGEKVSFVEGQLFINGKEFKENEVVQLDKSSMDEITLEEDEYFVLGDNRSDSMDSRLFGPIKAKTILGKAYFLK